jgi:hypothetical protein
VGDNGPIDATLKVLSDGLGTNLPMEASTTGVNFTGTTTVSGVAVANTTQVAAKQDTLVSGTNIKTINSTSILGSGNIAVVTSPSGVAGAIQFSDGSAFASDATKFFWDNTNKRLGIGTNTPNSLLNVIGTGGVSGIRVNTSGADSWMPFSDGNWYVRSNGVIINDNNTAGVSIGINSPTTARLMVKGSGSTSATTSLLVQNSAGTELFKIQDDKTFSFGSGTLSLINVISSVGTLRIDSNAVVGVIRMEGNQIGMGNNTTGDASALLTLTTTTKGFLPPRMTTTQKNAIASPATGLVLYDSTTNKLQCYNGSTWNDLF